MVDVPYPDGYSQSSHVKEFLLQAAEGWRGGELPLNDARAFFSLMPSGIRFYANVTTTMKLVLSKY